MGFLIYLIIALLLSVFIGRWSDNKGKGFAFGFLISLIFSPLIGLIVVGISQSNKKVIEEKTVKLGESKKCPYCSEIIKSEAIKCRYCGSDLPVIESFPQVPTDQTTITCPSCNESETTKKSNLKNIIATKKFSVKYSGFTGNYKFQCNKCEKKFNIESQFL